MNRVVKSDRIDEDSVKIVVRIASEGKGKETVKKG